MLRHSNVLVTTSGFCGQLEKVYFDTSAGDRICGAKNQLSQPRHISHGRENTEGKNKMSKFTDRTRNIDFRINASDWFVGINNPSSTASKITMSVSSAAANIIFKRKPFILAKNSSELPIKNRIPMVDKKLRYLQWLIINSAFCAGSHKNRLKSFEVGDHNYCRMLSERIEFNSRLGISKHFRLLRVDAESSNFSESLPNKGFFRDRSVCIPSITSDTNLRCMETRS